MKLKQLLVKAPEGNIGHRLCILIESVKFFYGGLLDGCITYITNDFQSLSGRIPKSLSQLILDTKPSGVWNA